MESSLPKRQLRQEVGLVEKTRLPPLFGHAGCFSQRHVISWSPASRRQHPYITDTQAHRVSANSNFILCASHWNRFFSFLSALLTHGNALVSLVYWKHPLVLTVGFAHTNLSRLQQSRSGLCRQGGSRWQEIVFCYCFSYTLDASLSKVFFLHTSCWF